MNSCDGKEIFPKLPYYVRYHYKSWKRNQEARNQVASADFKNGAERLKKLNQDSAKALARPEVEAPMRMGNDATEAGEAPSDRIDASTTGGGVAPLSRQSCTQKRRNEFELKDNAPPTKANELGDHVIGALKPVFQR